jgi:hypothetical protein
MHTLFAAAPLAVVALIVALHAIAIAHPSNAPMAIGYHVLSGLSFALFFALPQALSRSGHRTTLLSVHAAHLHIPKPFAVAAYCLLLISVVLLAVALLGEFDPRRRATAFWLVALACPSVVWFHVRVKTSPNSFSAKRSEA